MGAWLSVVWQTWFPGKEVKILMVGLDAAGKTTILYKLALGETVNTTATVGSNVETFSHKNLSLEVWDLGGQATLRTFWSPYYKGADAVIVVVDSTDRARLHVAKGELWSLEGHDDLRGVPLLVFANKQDAKMAMSVQEISTGLALTNIKTHDWHIQSCCALTGEGLLSGLDWIAQRTRAAAAPAAPQPQQQLTAQHLAVSRAAAAKG